MNDVDIRIFQRWQITYSPYSYTFTAKRGAKTLTADTQEQVEELIKEQIRESRRFKPLQVIQTEYERVGRITSRVADSDTHIYFSYKEEGAKRAKHTQEKLESSGWGSDTTSYFVLATPANLKILEKIRKKREQISSIEKRISKLSEKFKDPVTWELLVKKGRVPEEEL